MPFKIKICGITNASDARNAIELGADAIGLNFYSKSLRSVNATKAAELVSAARMSPEGNKAKIVGVFVNECADTINELARSVGLDLVQLHGNESIDTVSMVNMDVIRVIRIMDQNFESVIQVARQWHQAGVKAVLLDAGNNTTYGGTGEQLNWDSIAALQIELPLLLAGGLKCDNVSQAIQVARPHGVDVASGIEKFPGSKDANLMRKFIENAKNAFSLLD